MNIYTSVEDGLKKQAMDRLHEALQTLLDRLLERKGEYFA
jgi:hypothetical protein